MRRTYRMLYRLGITPWDRSDIPGPVVDVVEGPGRLPAGRAVDLGCGTGAQARYLAQHGWSVTAVDYAVEAIRAARRGYPAHPKPSGDNQAGEVIWRVADVTDLALVDPDGDLRGAVALLLDNGCLHGISQQDWPGWAATVDSLAAPNATLLVRAAPSRRRGIGPRGINDHQLAAVLGDHWRPAARPGPGWYRYTHA